jgi:class 3 adenylate cyclase
MYTGGGICNVETDEPEYNSNRVVAPTHTSALLVIDSGPLIQTQRASRLVSRQGSCTSASPATRGLAILPRRVSQIDRTDSSEIEVLRNIFGLSRPPEHLFPDLEAAVEDVFMFAPKLVRDYSSVGDYQEVEVFLYRRTRKLVAYLKSADEGLDRAPTGELEPVMNYFSFLRRGRRKRKPGDSSTDGEPSFKALVTGAEFTDWLAEFLFVLWYTSLPYDEEESMSSIRQVCRQIVLRSVTSRDQHELKRSRWVRFLLQMLPWRFRLRLGDRGPFGEKSWNELIYEPFERDRLKPLSSVEPMHWFTREFSDPGLEKTFQVDRANRLLTSCYWPFFLTLVLATGYVVIQYGLLSQDYSSITLVRLLLTEPVTLLVVAAVIQLVGHSVIFPDIMEYRENFFLYQFIFAVVVCCSTAAWMYQVRSGFIWVVWPINEGFTMAFVLICTSCLFYIRFVYVVGLTVITSLWTLLMRYVFVSHTDFSLFTIQQGIAIMAAIAVVWGGRYLFETHTRRDFLLTRNLFHEAERSDRLLRNIFPNKVIQHLKSVDQANNTRSGGGKLSVTSTAGIAEGFDEVSILFADVVGFTTYSSHISPEELVLFLNELFTCFDDIAEELGLEKIKTIGDAYMAVAGLEHGHDAAAAAAAAARMGLRVVELMMSGQFRDHENRPLEARVGIHTGSCVAGVIGRKKFIYDIWGDAVNTASRMESTGETNRVHCSEHTAFLLQGEFELETRGEIEVKGKGSMTTYFITE